MKYLSINSTSIEIAEYTIETLDKCLQNPCPALNKNLLVSIIDALKQSDKTELCGYLIFFRTYMEPLLLFKQDGRGKSIGYYENIVRSTLALHVMFSIVENRTALSKTQSFISFLKENFKDIKTPEDISKFSKKHESLFPKNAARSKKFYSQWLTEKEKKDAIKHYRGMEQETGKKSFATIEEVIGDIYGAMRSGFSHSLGTQHLRKDPYILIWEDKEGKSPLIKVYPNLPIDWFLSLSWLAILRSFGYPTA